MEAETAEDNYRSQNKERKGRDDYNLEGWRKVSEELGPRPLEEELLFD